MKDAEGEIAKLALHGKMKIAGRTFTAKCGHTIRKGEGYISYVDHCCYNRFYDSKCLDCAEWLPRQEPIEFKLKKVGVDSKPNLLPPPFVVPSPSSLQPFSSFDSFQLASFEIGSLASNPHPKR